MALVEYDVRSLPMTEEVRAAERLRDKLIERLTDRRENKILPLERFYDGDHPLPQPPERMTKYEEAAETFRTLSRLGITNFMAPVADAPAQRLRVTGFHFGEAENFENDELAWRIWQRNHMDADSRLLHHKALVVGNSFALVWPGPAGAEITVEDSSQAIVAYRPGSRRDRIAGLKCWCEDDGTKRVVLYLPTEVYKWKSMSEQGALLPWQPDTDDTWPIANPLGVVPLVEYRANADLRPAPFGGGFGEFEKVLPIQRRINKTVFDRLVTAEFQAFRQRWAVGWTPDDPNEAMKASMRTLWTFDDAETKVGDFQQADFTPFLSSVRDDVKQIAAITSTPLYALGELVNPPSGDALMALHAGLVAKTEGHRDDFTESHEEVESIAMRAEGEIRSADDAQSQVDWASVVHHTFAERADAAVKYLAADVPREFVWSDVLGFGPQQIKRFKVMKADEALFAPPPNDFAQ